MPKNNVQRDAVPTYTTDTSGRGCDNSHALPLSADKSCVFAKRRGDSLNSHLYPSPFRQLDMTLTNSCCCCCCCCCSPSSSDRLDKKSKIDRERDIGKKDNEKRRKRTRGLEFQYHSSCRPFPDSFLKTGDASPTAKPTS